MAVGEGEDGAVDLRAHLRGQVIQGGEGRELADVLGRILQRHVDQIGRVVPEAWQKVIADKRRPGKLVRRHFEICVFTCLADELVRGDVTAVGSEAYANWQSQPLSWQDCQPHLATYCAEIGLPTTASEFAAQLKTRIKNVAATVDAGYPDNAGLLIDEQGRPSLKARKSAGHSPEALKLAGAQVAAVGESDQLGHDDVAEVAGQIIDDVVPARRQRARRARDLGASWRSI
nr:hypothetical protein [Nonomuraea sp. MG754425]